MADAINDGTESIPTTQRAELLRRIASSAELRRAARLREFLSYVGGRALEDEHAQISETEIGVHVFGRPENYDTSIDNIVRVNASELRKRIAAYYEAEGLHEPILLELPRRNYTPQFHRRPVEPKPEPAAPAPDSRPDSRIESREETAPPLPAAAAVRPLRGRIQAFVLPVLLVALTAACILLSLRLRRLEGALYGWQAKPALNGLWSGILESSRPTDLVIADTSLSVVEDILRTRISLNGYLNRDYERQIEASGLEEDLRDSLRVVVSRNNVSLGDVRVAEKILALDPLSGQIHLQSAREYRTGSINNDNVVLIGSSRSNPWSAMFEDRLNFVVDSDPGRNQMLVRNRHPLPGEEAAYITPVDPNSTAGYGVISYLPNPSHTADVLIVAGTTAEATEAAGDFLMSESSLEGLRERLRVRRLPYFELLLRTTRLVGTPLSAEVVACRTSPAPPVNPR